MSRIALGTAQFGLDYGINNRRGKIPAKEISDILSYSVNNGIDMLDTAAAYGDSENSIGSFLATSSAKFKIISKLPKNAIDPIASLASTLKNLKIYELYSYLFHDFKSYTDNRRSWEKMSALKQQGKVRKIGFSLYYPAELEKILEDKISLDLVQLPYNVLDRRFEKYFPELKDRGVEIHVRSVFLQGLFFREISSLPSYYDRIKVKLQKLREIAVHAGCSILELTLGFVLANRSIDRLVVGVDSLRNLSDIASAEKLSRNIGRLPELQEDDESIILPFRWEKAGENVR